MKQLTCEMCGSTELIKQDGMYVCQSCGTKYSVEEAKKMMIEGTVDVQGTVKIDVSEELEGLYALARRARDSFNYEDALKYYEAILVKEPNSWEATWYQVYFKIIVENRTDVGPVGVIAENALGKAVESVSKNISSVEEQINILKELKNSVLDLYTKLDKVAEIVGNDGGHYVANKSGALLVKCGYYAALHDYFGSNTEIMEKYGVMQLKEHIPELNDGGHRQKLIACIKKYDSNYCEPAVKAKSSNAEAKSSGGCYVATAVYGSYDCPQVWTLRRYRDYTLAETWYGRAFIRTYYAISPALVKWFGHTEWFKKMWKGKLDRMVANLQADGVESTPYEDRTW